MTAERPQLAKLTRPRLHKAVARERLFRLLDEAREGERAIWICSPPGAGKTTFVASYLENRRIRGYWYHFDSGDKDPATTFYYLTALAKQSQRGACSTLPYFTSEYLQDLPGFTRRFFRTFFARMPAGSVLVMDNYQEAASGEVNRILANAMTELPEHLNLVIVSRTEPPAELARIVANNLAALIGWPDLRLTHEEGAAIARAGGLTDAAVIDALVAKADGWVAGVTLMLAATRRGGIVGDAQGLDSGKAVFGYFANELLEKASERTRALLLQTALFPQFSAEMAVELTGQRDADDVLGQLYQQHYFTERRSAESPTYRYHDLFRQFLREKGKDFYEREELRQMRHGAGLILLRENMPEPAIDLLEQADDRITIADTIERYASQFLSQGRWQPLVAWCDAAQVGEQRPWVTYWHGLAVAATDPQAGRRVLERAYQRFVAEGDRLGQTLTCSAIMDSFFQHWEPVPELDAWIERMEELLNDYGDMPEESRARALSSMVVSLLHRQPCNPSLAAYAEEAYMRVSTTTDANQKCTMAASLIYYYDLLGATNRANDLIAMTEQFVDQADVLPVNALTWWYRCGLHYLYTSNVEAATKPCYRGLELARTHGAGWFGYVGAFMAEITQGRLDAATQLLTESRQALDPSNRVHILAVHWIELWLLVIKNHMPEAIALWEEFRRLPIMGVPIHTAFNHVVIFVLVHKGEHEDALARVQRYQSLLKDMRSPIIDFNLLNMEAYVRLKSGDLAGGRDCLAAMMRIGRASDITTTFCWIPEMVSYLCGRALELGIESDYVQRLIRKRNLTPTEPDVATWPRPIKILTLGRFEMLRDGAPIEFSRKAPKKVVALLKAIVAHGRRGVTVEEIADSLWPDLESDAAHEAFATSLRRLRKLLGRSEAVRLIEGQISISSELCLVDVAVFDHLYESCMAAYRASDAALALQYAHRAVETYRGSFLPHDTEQPWSVPMRERLRTRFIRLVSEIGTHYERSGDLDHALEWFRRGIEADNLAEEFYQGLMRCYSRQGRKAEGAAVYRQLKQLLSVVLGAAPSQATQALGRDMLNGT